MPLQEVETENQPPPRPMAPMSQEAREFIVLGRRQSCAEPSVTHLLAATTILRILRRAKGLDHESERKPRFEHTFRYLGRSLHLSTAIDLILSCDDMDEEEERNIGRVGVLAATDLLLSGNEDILDEFRQILRVRSSDVWTESFLSQLFTMGLHACDDAKNNNTNNTEAYERICTLLLQELCLQEEETVQPALRVLCRSIQFGRFRTHDVTWDLLHTLKSRPTMKPESLTCIAGALEQHVNLRLDSLKKWIDDKSGELMLKILTSEQREASIMERHRSIKEEEEWFVGKVIDISDIEYWKGRWCPAEVLACHERHSVYIKYIGWSSYFNRWINTQTEKNRIAPLGQRSHPSALYGQERPPPSPRLPIPQPPIPPVSPLPLPLLLPVPPIPPIPPGLPLPLPLLQPIPPVPPPLPNQLLIPPLPLLQPVPPIPPPLPNPAVV